MKATIYRGSVEGVLPGLAAGSFDASFSDPPYGLGFMGKAWDHAVPGAAIWGEVARALRPGGHVLAFGGTRTFHRLTCGIEDAGFEVRDCLAWLYGSGFPKSLDVSAGVDRRRDWTALRALQGRIRAARTQRGWTQSEAARAVGLIGEGETLGGGGFMWFETGQRVPTKAQYERLKESLALGDESDEAFERAERETVSVRTMSDSSRRTFAAPALAQDGAENIDREVAITAPATDEAKRWSGYGTALKPAWEPCILAMKPLDGTFAANATRHGVAGLAIDASRIGLTGGTRKAGPPSMRPGVALTGSASGVLNGGGCEPIGKGRYPANVVLDEEAGAMLDAQGGVLSFNPAGAFAHGQPAGWPGGKNNIGRDGAAQRSVFGYGDSGGASRFFYCAKVGRAERGGSRHPTMKPVALCEYLARLLLPPPREDGAPRRLLVPFSGAGSEMIGALTAGWDEVVGIERETEYVADAARRMRERFGVLVTVDVVER